MVSVKQDDEGQAVCAGRAPDATGRRCAARDVAGSSPRECRAALNSAFLPLGRPEGANRFLASAHL